MSLFTIDPNLKPWERQKRESSQAWAAFVGYRDMKGNRSCRALAESLGKSASLLMRWSANHFWVHRCEAWDRYQDSLKRQHAIEEILKMSERHAQAAQAVQQVLALVPTAIVLKMRDDREAVINELQSRPIVDLLSLMMRGSRMFDVAVRIERQARGVESVDDDETNAADAADEHELMQKLLADKESRRVLKEIQTRIRAATGE